MKEFDNIHYPGPYKPGWRANNTGKCVDGPGNGFGFYGNELFPEFTLKTEEEANVSANMCNAAYQQGYERAQYDIRKALNIK